MMILENYARKAKMYRPFGYAVLWLFLGSMIWFVDTYTGRSYPMNAFMSGLLVVIGLLKLGYAIFYYTKRYRQVDPDS